MPDAPHSPRTSAADRVAPLCCLRCGYNLTGVCTFETPEGTCPECGRAFERGTLHRFQQAQQRNRPNLIAWLLIWPVVYAVMLPITSCCLIGMAGDLPGIGMMIALVVLLGACSFSGWWLAQNASLAHRAGREPDEVPAFYRYLFWPWLLFTLTHLVLTVVFFLGGCMFLVVLIGGV